MNLVIFFVPHDVLTYEQLLCVLSQGVVRIEAVPLSMLMDSADSGLVAQNPHERYELTRELLAIDVVPPHMGMDVLTPSREQSAIPESSWSRRPPRVRVPDSQVRGHIQPRARRP